MVEASLAQSRHAPNASDFDTARGWVADAVWMRAVALRNARDFPWYHWSNPVCFVSYVRPLLFQESRAWVLLRGFYPQPGTENPSHQINIKSTWI